MYRMDEEEEERVGNESASLRHRQMCHPAAAGRAPLMDPPGNSLRARRGCKTKLKHKALLAIIVYFYSFSPCVNDYFVFQRWGKIKFDKKAG